MKYNEEILGKKFFNPYKEELAEADKMKDRAIVAFKTFEAEYKNSNVFEQWFMNKKLKRLHDEMKRCKKNHNDLDLLESGVGLAHYYEATGNMEAVYSMNDELSRFKIRKGR